MKSPKGFQISQAVGLWRGTRINIPLMPAARCRGGKPRLNAASNSSVGVQGAASRVVNRLSASPSLLSFRLVFLAFFRSGPSAVPARTPATKKQLWSGTTSLEWLKEKERPARLLAPPAVHSAREFNSRASVQQTCSPLKMCRSGRLA